MVGLVREAMALLVVLRRGAKGGAGVAAARAGGGRGALAAVAVWPPAAAEPALAQQGTPGRATCSHLRSQELAAAVNEQHQEGEPDHGRL